MFPRHWYSALSWDLALCLDCRFIYRTCFGNSWYDNEFGGCPQKMSYKKLDRKWNEPWYGVGAKASIIWSQVLNRDK